MIRPSWCGTKTSELWAGGLLVRRLHLPHGVEHFLKGRVRVVAGHQLTGVAEDFLCHPLRDTSFSNVKSQHVDLIILRGQVGIDHRRIHALVRKLLHEMLLVVLDAGLRYLGGSLNGAATEVLNKAAYPG